MKSIHTRKELINQIAYRALCGNDMLEFYPLESRVLGPGDILESDRFAREPELAFVEFFENIVVENSFFHNFTPMLMFRSRLLQTLSRLCPKSIRRGIWKNWTKLRKMGYVHAKKTIYYNILVCVVNL